VTRICATDSTFCFFGDERAMSNWLTVCSIVPQVRDKLTDTGAFGLVYDSTMYANDYLSRDMKVVNYSSDEEESGGGEYDNRNKSFDDEVQASRTQEEQDSESDDEEEQKEQEEDEQEEDEQEEDEQEEDEQEEDEQEAVEVVAPDGSQKRSKKRRKKKQ
jgi:hypothetical protein